MTPAPIVLFVYNRPEHTARTLASLAANPLARESDLIVYADGPKKPEHERSVQAARAVARETRGFRSVRIIERERNLGLAKSITTGVTEVCDQYGRAIVVEDDLVLAPSFLKFLNEGLDRYENETRVLQVSGYMFPGVCDGEGATFLPLTTTWGWGVWRRAWRYLDHDLSGLDQIEAAPQLRRRFDVNGTYNYFDMAKKQKQGEADSWGIAWYLSVFLRDGLVLYPNRSLVMNIGMDGSGVHGRASPLLQQNVSGRVGAESLALPDMIEIDHDVLSSVETLLRSIKPSVLARMRAWLSSNLRNARLLNYYGVRQ